ncbi:serine hydrolase domain-containing protein [Labedaea rhizosphaerae]|uniref:CubicO group peptidase (Beta-lactamase class C family) n=1 Tax=Labedaea rhizosphaerae TaxID=598644 RepID=A0A4R6SMW6_LABRH|nr:serine hydrolase domain-containing protein [Labedaea rhizosphaerae]TDQ04513.1 CubicO group peptidase (beta-lactamase class C family) [Labedaea rhizosphaerae]
MLPTTEFALLRRLAAEQAGSRAPSMVAAIVRGGEIRWSGVRGFVGDAAPTADTQYRIGSITKTFIAVLVMRLRDEGKLDLSDLLDKHVPGTSMGHVTIAQLLAHTAGLTSESPGQWWERSPGNDWAALDASMTGDELKHRPGARFHYSNVGYGVLGELVARLRGTTWLAAVNSEILAPLAMSRTTPMPTAPHAQGYAVHPFADILLPEPAPDAKAMAPAGQLWSTLTDLARWVAFIGGDTGEVLHPDTLAEMREPAHVEDGDYWTSGYGLGLQTLRDSGRRIAGHSGSMPGFLATAFIDPVSTTGALALTNTTAGVAMGALTGDLIRLVEEYEPDLPAPWRPMAEYDPEMLALTGLWHWGPSPYVLRLKPGGWLDLAPMADRGRASRFRPNGDGTFTGLDGYYAGEKLRIGRDAQGVVTHLDLATFIFTRTPYDPAAPVPGGVDPEGWR